MFGFRALERALGAPRTFLRSAVFLTALLGGDAVAVANAAELQLRALDGSSRSLDSLHGQIVLVNFWATWCLPCLEEMPLLGRLHREYAERGVEFVGASADDAASLANIPPLLEEADVDFPTWTGVSLSQMVGLGVGAKLPATMILDRDGSIAFRLIGVVTEEAVRSRLEWLLGDRAEAMPDAFLAAATAADDHDDHNHGAAHEHEAAAGTDASLVPS